MGHRVLGIAVVAVLLVLSISLLHAQQEANQPPGRTTPEKAEAEQPPKQATAKAAKAESGQPSWPQFNGPKGDNRSPDTGLLASWPDGGPRLLWKYEECGVGFSSVSVADGMVFTAGDFDAEEKVLALDMAGRRKWIQPNGKAWTSPWPGSRSTPTYSDGMVYHLNPHGQLSAYKAGSGEPAWSIALKCERLSQGGYAESVLIDGNNLICMPGDAKEFIVALNKKTGDTVWVSDFKRTDYDRASYVSPILVNYKNRKQIIHLSLFQLVALDAATGKVQWSVRHKGPEHCEVVACSPIWLDGRVFMTKGYGVGSRMFAVDPSGRSVTQVWEHKAADSEHGAPVASRGCIYVPGNYVYPLGGWREKEAKEGSLYCLDAASGKERWVARIGRCTLTYAEGRIYCLNEFGKVYLIEADPERCKIVGELQVPRTNRRQTLVHPVVIGGRMYIRDHDALYVYDVKG